MNAANVAQDLQIQCTNGYWIVLSYTTRDALM